ncbi:MAG: hypothetical protein IJY39_01245 [Clostridia bacterium]|nr:hypothetical protein [Clostridia bacterium]MBQ9805106.1 hypothetical protein [Clostridia bacterium]MBQ9807162.1 hypothetical protein [Clostridia bacterium]
MAEHLFRLTKRINFAAYNQTQTAFELFQKPVRAHVKTRYNAFSKLSNDVLSEKDFARIISQKGVTVQGFLRFARLHRSFVKLISLKINNKKGKRQLDTISVKSCRFFYCDIFISSAMRVRLTQS